jgi:hypothetical protein
MIFLVYAEYGEQRCFHGTFDNEAEAKCCATSLTIPVSFWPTADLAYVKQFGVGTIYHVKRLPDHGFWRSLGWLSAGVISPPRSPKA